MNSKFCLALHLLLFISISPFFSAAAANENDGDGGNAGTLPCIQKLIPCQPFLHTPSTPPVTCCAPVKEMVENDAMCLCALFNNPNMLRTLNISKENALNLPKACGANADISVCNNSEASPSGSPATPSSPTAPTNDTSSSDEPKENKSKEGIAATVSAVTKSVFVLQVVALIKIFFF